MFILHVFMQELTTYILHLRTVNKEEASNRVFTPPQDVEMQDPPRDKRAAQVVVKTREVPAIEVVRTMEVLAIEADRTRA